MQNRIPMLEVSHLKTYFKVGQGKRRLKVKAVDDISFTVHDGEVLGLVGESGCGKTTTARTIVRLYRPTDGEIRFDGEIVGSGHNEYYRLMKYERIEYRRKLLELNSSKYAIHLINQDYLKKVDALKKEIESIKKKLADEIAQINTSLDTYKKMHFEMGNDYRLLQEITQLNYNNKRTELINLSKNVYVKELNDTLKSLRNILKRKIGGIKESAGLDKEGKEKQFAYAKEVYERDAAEARAQYGPLIEQRAQNLLPKEELARKLDEIKIEFSENYARNQIEYQEKIASLVVPNDAADQQMIAQASQKYEADIASIRHTIESLDVERRVKISEVEKTTKIDKLKRDTIIEEHKFFVRTQRDNIRASRRNHYNSEANQLFTKIQMIYQDPISSLNPRMTVQEIVSEGLIIQGVSDKEELKVRVAEALNLVGLPADFASRYPHEFSGGQRQRIGIARALIMNPKFVIADEPISALDVSIRAQVINLLQDLKEKLGLTILFVAHDLSVVRFFCDRIAVMYAGKIVEMGVTEEIFTNPLHPYTKSLLSAIPQPDPDSEKTRQRISYNPGQHDYSVDKPSMREVTPSHSVFVNEAEYKQIKEMLK